MCSNSTWHNRSKTVDTTCVVSSVSYRGGITKMTKGIRIPSICYWGGSSIYNWSNNWFNVSIGLSSNFLMDVWLSSNLFLNMWFSSNLLMNIRLSGNLLMNIRFSSRRLLRSRSSYSSSNNRQQNLKENILLICNNCCNVFLQRTALWNVLDKTEKLTGVCSHLYVVVTTSGCDHSVGIFIRIETSLGLNELGDFIIILLRHLFDIKFSFYIY
jgi:hypothetical protein